MRISYLQHVPFEGPARIAEWAEQGSHLITGTRLDLGESLPGITDFDMLVIMGGPMSVNDEHRYPWLASEKQLVLDAIAAHRPILGVCLSAQLIASAMGWVPRSIAAGRRRSADSACDGLKVRPKPELSRGFQMRLFRSTGTEKPSISLQKPCARPRPKSARIRHSRLRTTWLACNSTSR
jgi:hypothetical protein